MWSVLPLLLLAPARAGDLKFSYPTTLGPGDRPALMVTLPRATEILGVDCEAGGRTYSWEEHHLPGGATRTFSWERDPGVTEASCLVQARFEDGTAEGVQLSLHYSYGEPLKVLLEQASVDLEAHTLTVGVTARVERAEIQAWGAGHVLLDQREVQVGAGPGTVTLPWVGEPSEVVLLEVTLHGQGSWASFTYSPWFLDIPHEDVLFPTDSWEIPEDEVWKLERTLEQLQQVVAKYGDLVPVKLYIAGCTDTVGSAEHNLELSRNRARSIARWLRAHGFTYPIYYHGFGEGLLAVPTGDGVDEPLNRRALYIVSANPPPAGSGIPQVRWTPL